MLGKITKTTVERLGLGELLWDADHREAVKGFGVRRQRGDGRFYLLRYRINGRERWIKIGEHGSPWTADSARNEAKRLLGLVASRSDPAVERDTPRAESCGAAIERYLAKRQRDMRPRTFGEATRYLRQHAKPLHRLTLGEIDRRTIAGRLDQIEAAHGAATRNRARSALSAFFGWAIRQGLCESNPVEMTDKAAEGGGRERVLTDAELGEVWAALGEDRYGDIVRLLMLTGQRREEIGGLRWSEITEGPGGPIVTLPPERTKNKRQHALPLSPPAYAIVQRQSRRKERDMIFGRGDGRFSGWSQSKAALDARIFAARGPKAKPMPAWTLHDLRRTVATVLHDQLGVLPHIVEAVLNHVGHRAGVAGVYNRARYEGPMRDALDAWAAHVAAVVA